MRSVQTKSSTRSMYIRPLPFIAQMAEAAPPAFLGLGLIEGGREESAVGDGVAPQRRPPSSPGVSRPLHGFVHRWAVVHPKVGRWA